LRETKEATYWVAFFDGWLFWKIKSRQDQISSRSNLVKIKSRQDQISSRSDLPHIEWWWQSTYYFS